MNLRTYELIAHYIAAQHGITVKLEPNAVACVNTQTKVITLPSNLETENIYPALATLMHEAAHIKMTKFPENIVKDKLEKDILNAMEDTRIDRANFGVLPNIKEFYNRLYLKGEDWKKRHDMAKVPLMKKALNNAIVRVEGFPKYQIKGDQETDAFESKHKDELDAIFWDTSEATEEKDWPRVKKNIEKVIKLLHLENEPREPLDQEDGEGEAEGDGEGKPKMGKGNKPIGGQKGNIIDATKDEAVSQGQKGDGTSFHDLGIVHLREVTREKFKDLLSIKETRFVNDGNIINTDNLMSFHLGEIDDLFKEDIKIKRRKAKIQFLMDGSGSMHSQLEFGDKRKLRRDVVSGSVVELVDILDELRASDGIDVDYDVSLFDDDYYRCSKTNWREKYKTIGGGTNLESAFKQAQEDLLKDKTVDGTKIMILLTDGEVSGSEIDCIKREIQLKNEDVRFLVIGVGSQIGGEFVEKIIGDHNIIAAETADLVLLETIMDCLG
jgi:hypothetical protein